MEDANTYLERLDAEMKRDGWLTRIRPDGRLQVTNPDAGDLAEVIGCRQAAGGGWEFLWSWGDVIGPAGDVAGAAEQIKRVLRPVDGPVADATGGGSR